MKIFSVVLLWSEISRPFLTLALLFLCLSLMSTLFVCAYLWVSVCVCHEGGCGAFIALSWPGTIALFWPMSPERGSSIRRPRHSVCQHCLVWDWVSTATWTSEHRNAIVPLSRLWPDQTHIQTHMHMHINRHMHVHMLSAKYVILHSLPVPQNLT